jgi:hypothetical protein
VARRDTLAGFILQKSRQSPGKHSRKRIKRSPRKNPRDQMMKLWAAPRVRRVPGVLLARKATSKMQQTHLPTPW